MKKSTFLILTILLSLSYLNANAKKWRVNSTPSIQANFNSLNDAINSLSVLAGDTIFLEGSLVSYGEVNITKPLVIRGPGYFLFENQQTQSNKVPAKINNLTFSPGSNGSIVSGVYINQYLIISESNIVVENNFIGESLYFMANNLANIKIAKSIINAGIIQYSMCQPGAISNVIVSNNYIHTKTSGYTYDCAFGYLSGRTLMLGTNFSGIFSNNVFEGGTIESYNISYQNNIFITSPIYSIYSSSFTNNICDGTQLPTGNNNQQNVVMTDVFVGASASSFDGKFILKAGSPSIGAANDNGDCGIFGGADPYMLSGVSGPAIYEILMPNSGSPATGINITLKAKAN